MRRFLTLGIVPALIAGTLLVASPPPPAAAADGLSHTAVTTYQVLPDKNSIHVVITFTLKNTTPDTSCGPWCVLRWYYTSIDFGVEAEATAIKASASAGSVKVSTVSSGTYYRWLRASFSNLYYPQTRRITISYDIAAGPRAAGGYRALQAYASLCMIGHGVDSGVVQAVLPNNLVADVTYGTMPDKKTSGENQVIGSGSVPNASLAFYCIDATDKTKLTNTAVTAATQKFNIQGWPEDTIWGSGVQSGLTTVAAKLTAFTGLKFPGDVINLQETAGEDPSQSSGVYEPSTKTLMLPEVTSNATITHELAHVWFNRNLFTDIWAQEGFAAYSEQSGGIGAFSPCKEPGAYPGSGTPNLTNWEVIDANSTSTDEAVAEYQYQAACYVVTTLSEAMGPANFKAMLAAMVAGGNPYAGKDAKAPAGATPTLSAKNVLDFIDERGLVPAGNKTPNMAQEMFARYGIYSDYGVLADRGKSRATYRTLSTAAGKWSLPVGVRTFMSNWDFTNANKAMVSAQQILDLRKSIESSIPGFTFDGSTFQTKFENAKTQADLDALLALMKKEETAGKDVAAAAKLNSAGRNPIEMIGLLGSDTSGPLAKAKELLAAGKYDEAATEAKNLTNSINGSLVGGLLRLVILLVLVAAAVVGVFLVRRRRMVPVAALATAEGVDASSGVPVDGVAQAVIPEGAIPAPPVVPPAPPVVPPAPPVVPPAPPAPPVEPPTS